jgi:hypothetical protein
VLLAKGTQDGFEWEVVRNRIGYRCGYVRVPAGHPWYGQGYDDVRTADGDWPDVHGGLTFAEPDTDCGKGGDDSAWWLGFDCGHAGDAPDPSLPGGNVLDLPGGVIRTTEYAVEECRSLARQAAAVSPSVIGAG